MILTVFVGFLLVKDTGTPKSMQKIVLTSLSFFVVIQAGLVGAWQTFFSLLLSIPLAPMTGLSVEDLPGYFYDGFMCVCGYNTILESTPERPADTCESAPILVFILVIANTGFQFLITLILRYGTANMLRMSSAIMVPTCNVAFSLPEIPHSVPMSPTDLWGLIFVMSGLIVYRFINEVYGIINKILGFDYFEVEVEADADESEIGIRDIDIRSFIGSSAGPQIPFALSPKIRRHNTLMGDEGVGSREYEFKTTGNRARASSASH